MKKQKIALFSATLATMAGIGFSHSTEARADASGDAAQAPTATAEDSKATIAAVQSEVTKAQETASATQAEATTAKEEAYETSQAAASKAQQKKL